MPGFLFDENLQSFLVDALRRRLPEDDVLSVHDVGLTATDDRDILEWPANHGRIVVSRYKNTMREYAESRVRDGLPMPGVVFAHEAHTARLILDTLKYVALYGLDDEWEGQVLFVGSPPLG